MRDCKQRRPNAHCGAVGEASGVGQDADTTAARAGAQRHDLPWPWRARSTGAPSVQKSSSRCNLSRAAVFLGGYCRFAAVTVEVTAALRRSWRRSFAPSWRSRRRSFYTNTKTTQKFASHATSACFFAGTCLGFAPLRGTCAARRIFRRNRRKKKKKQAEKNHLHWPWAVVMWRSSPCRLGGHGGLLRTRPVVIGGGLSWFFNLAVKTPWPLTCVDRSRSPPGPGPPPPGESSWRAPFKTKGFSCDPLSPTAVRTAHQRTKSSD